MELSSQENLLGDFTLKHEQFPQLKEIFQHFLSSDFKSLSKRTRFTQVNQTLAELILKAPKESFLLTAVIDYIARINKEDIIGEPYEFVRFEFWLNHFSHLNDKDNASIRAKIMGKEIPREVYQAFFPIGMGKVYSGTHFVTAHMSPDLDTAVASFWGWVDAFAARIGTGQHIWSLPGESPNLHMLSIFLDFFGESVLTCLTRTSGTLTLSASDLVHQKNVVKASGNTLINKFDVRTSENAILYVDEAGHYLGDWRLEDADMVRQIVLLFKSCLQSFENNLHVKLISAFGKQDFKKSDIPPLLSSIFSEHLNDCETVKLLNDKQRNDLNTFLIKVLNISEGLSCTFGSLINLLDKIPIPEVSYFKHELESLSESNLFDSDGSLKEDRPKLFEHMQKIIIGLDKALLHISNYIDRLDIVMAIKAKVLGFSPHYVTPRSDVEEIRVKMKNYRYLTVAIPEDNGRLFPLGIILASDLRKTILGTVTLRDFCNLEEIKMASYLEVISVIDHHKSSISTLSPPIALIGDAQSCNVLVAEQAFKINDQYSLGGMTLQTIQSEIKNLSQKTLSGPQTRILQRLLQKEMVANNPNDYSINANREIAEYFCFLHAILDDTDLLSKVSPRDIECVAGLLNRLKSLILKKETEIISLDDIPRDKTFAKVAAKRILQNKDMYSIYKKIFAYKEQEVEENINLCIEGKPSNIFADTKEQNGCCRVGQTKIFSTNVPLITKNITSLRQLWLENAENVFQANPHIDLHMHMISTIPTAEEVYADNIGHYSHKDELWIWVPSTQLAHDHLIAFLNAFQSAPEMINNTMNVEFLGSNATDLEQIFSRNFIKIPMKINADKSKDLPIAVLHFDAGSINSRKSMITPYLPHLIT